MLNQFSRTQLLLGKEAMDKLQNSRTCEIGLTTNSGVNYKSIAYLVDEVTTPRPAGPAE